MSKRSLLAAFCLAAASLPALAQEAVPPPELPPQAVHVTLGVGRQPVEAYIEPAGLEICYAGDYAAGCVLEGPDGQPKFREPVSAAPSVRLIQRDALHILNNADFMKQQRQLLAAQKLDVDAVAEPVRLGLRKALRIPLGVAAS